MNKVIVILSLFCFTEYIIGQDTTKVDCRDFDYLDQNEIKDNFQCIKHVYISDTCCVNPILEQCDSLKFLFIWKSNIKKLPEYLIKNVKHIYLDEVDIIPKNLYQFNLSGIKIINCGNNLKGINKVFESNNFDYVEINHTFNLNINKIITKNLDLRLVDSTWHKTESVYVEGCESLFMMQSYPKAIYKCNFSQKFKKIEFEHCTQVFLDESFYKKYTNFRTKIFIYSPSLMPISETIELP